MTIEEQKIAVSEKLPGLVMIETDKGSAHKVGETVWYGGPPPDSYNLLWKPSDKTCCRLINWPTEGLAVCHEAEKLLGDLWHAYMTILGGSACECQGYAVPWDGLTATYEQRLEALCRVWWPERFNNPKDTTTVLKGKAYQ